MKIRRGLPFVEFIEKAVKNGASQELAGECLGMSGSATSRAKIRSEERGDVFVVELTDGRIAYARLGTPCENVAHLRTK